MSDNKEMNTEEISIESFADIYDQEKDSQEDKKKSILDDLKPEVSIEDIEKTSEEKTDDTEKQEESGDASIENYVNDEIKDTKSFNNNSLSTAVKKLIDNGIIPVFDDGKEIDEYNEEDWEQLLNITINDVAKNSSNYTRQSDFSSLSPDLQALVQYERNGAKPEDMKKMMYSIINAKNSIETDISSTEGQKDIIRTYYTKKNVFPNARALEKEINRLEDAGELKERASEFKPMLDEIQIAEVNHQMKIQEQKKRQIEESLKMLNDDLYNQLNVDELNGIPISDKVKNMLYKGLTTSNYQVASGKRTNLLYYLLENKFYSQKSDRGLVAEATWLLADPEGYKQALTESISRKIANETANKLKNEQQGRIGSGQQINERRVIKRPMRSMFER